DGWGEMDRPKRRRKRPLEVILVDPPVSIPLAPIVLDEAPENLPLATIIVDDEPVLPTASVPVPGPPTVNNVPKTIPAVPAPVQRKARYQDAESSLQVLLWLAFNQAWIMFGIMAGVAFVLGFFVPAQGQVLWPVATLLLGVSCGTAAFAQEQSDLSYQFLAAQHFPLKSFWNVKIVFWFLAGVGAVLLMLASGGLVVLLSLGNRPGAQANLFPGQFHFGTLKETMGPVLFFSIWLVYGFCIGQVFVLLCRKSILAALLSGLVTAGALGLWLPSVLCRGMGGWQVWLMPLALLLATRLLMRAWAAGRIKERRPIALLIGIGLVCLAWAGLVFSRRALEIPDVGEPLDRVAFNKSMPQGQDNKAGLKIEEALGEFQKDPLNAKAWLPPLAAVADLPVGVIVTPAGDGQSPVLRHLPECQKMADVLGLLSRAQLGNRRPDKSFDHLAQMLALSRNLRSKVPLESYLVGIQIESSALERLDQWLANRKPPEKLLRHALDELNRHAAETPPPLDCLNTECFRAGGALANPASWTFFSGKDLERIPERWLAGGIAFSLDVPWEQERATRIWRVVWAGLYHNLQTPHWHLPDPLDGGKNIRADKEATRQIVQGWLPPPDGPAAAWTVEQLASTLDQSWLSDEKLFCRVKPLRLAGTRARWWIDSARLAVALGLYQIKEGKTAAKLADLVPKYLPSLPVDPYSGQDYHYRISKGEQVSIGAEDIQVRPGQAILWSTGPDRIDHGGTRHGAHLPLDDPHWADGFDLITVIPQWSKE
ncbi:MAG TPA: hypothetical protein VKE98_10980, partial [Gemmataceae bacterium]|nr:hypothetical protein [Gemmataceae bacterium]